MTTSIHDLLLNDRGFAFDPVNGDTYQLSATGLRIARLMQGGAEEPEILARLQEEFAVEEHTAQRDVQTFLSTLEQMGWKS